MALTHFPLFCIYNIETLKTITPETLIMKKCLFALTALVFMCSCEKRETVVNDPQPAQDFFRAEKMSWNEETKAGSELKNTDTEWKIGDKVTVFSKRGEYHNFEVVECDGMNATFDCHDFSFSKEEKYKLFYPSLPEGWLKDSSFVLTYNFVHENHAQESCDWCCSDWVVPSGNKALSFSLEHMNSLLNLELVHPADGQLKHCYLRALPLDAGEDEICWAYKTNYGFCYKDRYLYNGSEFVRNPAGDCNKLYEFYLVFEVGKEFLEGEVMKSMTPISSDDYSGLSDIHLILAYTNGKVFCSKVSLPDMSKGNCYTLKVSDFQELAYVPFSDIEW